MVTRSADTAVVMSEYGPLTRPPHTNSMPEETHQPPRFLLLPTAPHTLALLLNMRGNSIKSMYYFCLKQTLRTLMTCML